MHHFRQSERESSPGPVLTVDNGSVGDQDDDQAAAMPQRAIRRSARMASLPVSYAGRTALGLGKRLGGKPAEAVQAQIQAQTAAQLFRVMGELKGGAMKVGQTLSVFEAALPEEMAGPYRAALTKLQEAAPPMPVAVVHRMMREELGPDWRERFAEFNDIPAAAASIGQVHKATYRDGRVVAIKLQYPGAAKALMSDLKQAARMSKIFASWVPGLDVKPLLEELEARVAEELDYLHESQAQRQFAAAYEGDPEFVVPHVLAAGPRLIVSEWVDGTPLSKIISDGSQEERDRAGTLYMRFLLSGPARAGLLHADPHPGNFRMTPSGKLAVLDYGAAADLPDGFPPAVGRIIKIAIDEGDAASVLAGLRAEGFVLPGIEVDPDSLMRYLGPFVEPMRAEYFHYSRAWLRGQFARINDPRNAEYGVGFKLNLPPSYMLIHRVWMGCIGVLSQLDAEVPSRGEMSRWVPGFS
jgi:predicted unusual protein kinase regulating ubiquinone biosynthesis (AarF/ABC1/UbiB family)